MLEAAKHDRRIDKIMRQNGILSEQKEQEKRKAHVKIRWVQSESELERALRAEVVENADGIQEINI